MAAGSWTRTPRARILRAGLGLLAALHLWWGVWAVGWPHQFYRTFPGLGHHWTAGYPPYNEHLVFDVGAAFLAFAVLLGYPALRPDPKLARFALSGFLVFATLHLGFHLAHHGGLAGIDLIGSLLSLVVGVVVPLALLVTTRGGAITGKHEEQA